MICIGFFADLNTGRNDHISRDFKVVKFFSFPFLLILAMLMGLGHVIPVDLKLFNKNRQFWPK